MIPERIIFVSRGITVKDSPRPGQAHPVVTPEGIAAVEAIVKGNRRVTVNEIKNKIKKYIFKVFT